MKRQKTQIGIFAGPELTRMVMELQGKLGLSRSEIVKPLPYRLRSGGGIEKKKGGS